VQGQSPRWGRGVGAKAEDLMRLECW